MCIRDRSGKVDGASDWQIFWQLLFPLVRPIMVVSMILTFFGTYSDYLMPRIMITTASKFTLMLGLQTFIGANYAQEWGCLLYTSHLAGRGYGGERLHQRPAANRYRHQRRLMSE